MLEKEKEDEHPDSRRVEDTDQREISNDTGNNLSGLETSNTLNQTQPQTESGFNTVGLKDALDELSKMFPHVSKEVAQEVLVWNKGHLESTIESLLQMGQQEDMNDLVNTGDNYEETTSLDDPTGDLTGLFGSGFLAANEEERQKTTTQHSKTMEDSGNLF